MRGAPRVESLPAGILGYSWGFHYGGQTVYFRLIFAFMLTALFSVCSPLRFSKRCPCDSLFSISSQLRGFAEFGMTFGHNVVSNRGELTRENHCHSDLLDSRGLPARLPVRHHQLLLAPRPGSRSRDKTRNSAASSLTRPRQGRTGLDRHLSILAYLRAVVK